MHSTQYPPNSLQPFPNEQLVGFTVRECDSHLNLLPSLPSYFKPPAPARSPGVSLTQKPGKRVTFESRKVIWSPIHSPSVCKMHSKFFFFFFNFSSLIVWSFQPSGFYLYYSLKQANKSERCVQPCGPSVTHYSDIELLNHSSCSPRAVRGRGEPCRASQEPHPCRVHAS